MSRWRTFENRVLLTVRQIKAYRYDDLQSDYNPYCRTQALSLCNVIDNRERCEYGERRCDACREHSLGSPSVMDFGKEEDLEQAVQDAKNRQQVSDRGWGEP